MYMYLSLYYISISISIYLYIYISLYIYIYIYIYIFIHTLQHTRLYSRLPACAPRPTKGLMKIKDIPLASWTKSTAWYICIHKYIRISLSLSLSLYIYIYVCMCVYIYIYIHVYTRIHEVIAAEECAADGPELGGINNNNINRIYIIAAYND